jgi:uncharacterized iron-regulated membrane protein
VALRFRDVIFWLHLAAGVVAGSVILIMSATGVLLAYETQILNWADRGFRSAPPASGAGRLPVETLVAKAIAERPGFQPSSVTLQADPAAPATVSLGREHTLFLDAYTGRTLGESSPRVRGFFRTVTEWHRYLGGKDEGRKIGKAITGACNLAFLVLVVSGLYLWFPRQWTRRQVRNVAWFRRGLAGKARDFNWHNTIGLWVWAPLFVIVLSGVVLSYRWANDLVFQLSGEEPPAQRGPGGGGARRERQASEEEGELQLAGLNGLWTVAERRVAGWKSITLRLPEEADTPATFTILSGSRARPDLRAQLTLDRQTREVVKWEPYASQGPGRRARSWLRWLHTGEAGGFLGQTIAAIASAGATVLVWTGLAMAWRRFFSGKKKPVRSNNVASPVREVS